MARPSFLQRSFRPIARLTFIFTFLVIIAGSVVRTTQSGMGCPDWPKCFGYYIPPTNPAQVDFHAQHPYTKGMMIIENDTLWRVKTDFISSGSFERQNWEKYPKHNYAEFYVLKTWIEYINRLLGALMGILVLIVLLSSFFQTTRKKTLVALSLFLVFLTGFQAWLGALVVSSHLAPIKITTHMLAAMLLLALIQWILELSRPANEKNREKNADTLLLPLTFIALAFTVIQVILGTEVREGIDAIAAQLGYEQRETWIDLLPSSFMIHRAFSLLVLAVNTLLFIRARQNGSSMVSRYAMLSGFAVLAEIAVGLALVFFGMPQVAQPLHLLLATLLFSAQFAVLLGLWRSSRQTSFTISRTASE